MATITKFEDFDAYKSARELLKEVYAVTLVGEFRRDFALRDQVRRASISVVSNFAEGFERDGKLEFIQFLSIAKGSVGEIKAQIGIAHDLKYIQTTQFNRIYILADQTGKAIGGLIKYLRMSELRGLKFKKPEARNQKLETPV